MVDRRLLFVLARQDISKTSATAPAALSCQSVSEEPIHTLNGHPHKHVVRRTGVILNAESDPDSRGRSGRGSKRSLLSGGKRHNGLGEIVNPGSPRHPRGQRTEKSSEEGGHGGNSDHFFQDYSSEGVKTDNVQRYKKDMNGYVWVSNRNERSEEGSQAYV